MASIRRDKAETEDRGRKTADGQTGKQIKPFILTFLSVIPTAVEKSLINSDVGSDLIPQPAQNGITCQIESNPFCTIYLE